MQTVDPVSPPVNSRYDNILGNCIKHKNFKNFITLVQEKNSLKRGEKFMPNSLNIDANPLNDPQWLSEFTEYRESVYFQHSFLTIRSLALGDPTLLGVKDFVDFRVERMCDDISDLALRVPNKETMRKSQYFACYYEEIWNHHLEYTADWKSNIISIKNRKIDALLLRSMNCLNDNYQRFRGQIGFEANTNLHDINQFVNDFMLFLQHQNLAAPMHSHWLRVYSKLAMQVADWQLPLGVPDEQLIAAQPEVCVDILSAQLRWAADNGRIAEATRALGKLGAENWRSLSG